MKEYAISLILYPTDSSRLELRKAYIRQGISNEQIDKIFEWYEYYQRKKADIISLVVDNI